ncbi:glycosyltransferase family 2 protein [Hyunsoonleella aestuarii]|uniref:Glycosyltransferase 2-like domain-containing protein n=1 Tax=Hyunsoonleella aestuarii TaxID=912802 RepID=A0ABP8E755_9FLAO|nr:glycosyltransferase [Hyunsoonleella aestuarii]
MYVSIIIPTRNRYFYIIALINDLKDQNFKDFEIIVVDQSDEPKPILDCNHIITKSKGPCVSRNIASKVAKGNILVFLDDDARVGNDFIKEITKPILKGDYLAVAGAVCDLEGNYLRKDSDFLKSPSENFIKVLTNNPDSKTSRDCISFPGCCAAIEKNLFFEIGSFDESLDPTGAGEDRDLALRLYLRGVAIRYNSKAKLLHAVAPVGGSRDVGSRTLMLDVHTYKMSKKYFSEALTLALKKTILRKYYKNFFNSILQLRLVRTKFHFLLVVKRLLNQS